MKRALSLLAAPATALLLAGCMAEGPFPSLAQREVERAPASDPRRAAPNVPDDGALRERIGELLALARQGQREFESAYAPALAAANEADAPRSDSWIFAQEQISRAEAARAATTLALADLDRLALDRADRATSQSDFALLGTAIDEVEALASAQQQRIDRLRGLTAR